MSLSLIHFALIYCACESMQQLNIQQGIQHINAVLPLCTRSPWSNKYDPPIEDGAMPSARLRKLEVEANNAFDQYRDL